MDGCLCSASFLFAPSLPPATTESHRTPLIRQTPSEQQARLVTIDTTLQLQDQILELCRGYGLHGKS